MDAMLCEVYNAETSVIIPGSGTYGMEAVARQFATGKKVMTLRNGYFSWRWTDIFDTCNIPSESIVMQVEANDKIMPSVHHIRRGRARVHFFPGPCLKPPSLVRRAPSET